jgi:sortase (surface protein transpeptidase)
MTEDSVPTTETTSTPRRHRPVATVVVLVLTLLVGFVLLYNPFATFEAFAPEVTDAPSEIQGEVLPESLPVRLMIPSLDIDTGFETPLGLKSNGEIEVPTGYTDVAYYKYGPTPGELGPAVILGHVDSVAGPAVFFSLGQLKPNDEIKIEREDGTVAVFAVTDLQRHPQSGFPTTRVYSDIDHVGLRLITCTGLYEKDILRYTHNLIVFAKLVRVEGV